MSNASLIWSEMLAHSLFSLMCHSENDNLAYESLFSEKNDSIKNEVKDENKIKKSFFEPAPENYFLFTNGSIGKGLIDKHYDALCSAIDKYPYILRAHSWCNEAVIVGLEKKDIKANEDEKDKMNRNNNSDSNYNAEKNAETDFSSMFATLRDIQELSEKALSSIKNLCLPQILENNQDKNWHDGDNLTKRGLDLSLIFNSYIDSARAAWKYAIKLPTIDENKCANSMCGLMGGGMCDSFMSIVQNGNNNLSSGDAFKMMAALQATEPAMASQVNNKNCDLDSSSPENKMTEDVKRYISKTVKALDAIKLIMKVEDKKVENKDVDKLEFFLVNSTELVNSNSDSNNSKENVNNDSKIIKCLIPFKNYTFSNPNSLYIAFLDLSDILVKAFVAASFSALIPGMIQFNNSCERVNKIPSVLFLAACTSHQRRLLGSPSESVKQTRFLFPLSIFDQILAAYYVDKVNSQLIRSEPSDVSAKKNYSLIFPTTNNRYFLNKKYHFEDFISIRKKVEYPSLYGLDKETFGGYIGELRRALSDTEEQKK